MTSNSPELMPIKNCDLSLNFQPRAHWPDGLPAVAINRTVIAGFSQSLVFNHCMDCKSPDYPLKFASLFRSLHADLTAIELSELWELSRRRDESLNQRQDEIPIRSIFEQQQIRWNDNIEKLCRQMELCPTEIKNYLAEKRLSFGDLQPLLSLPAEKCTEFFLHQKSIGSSRSLISQSFELWVELTLMRVDLGTWSSKIHPEESLMFLKNLRYPDSMARDEQAKIAIKKIPFTNISQARWHRQGDQSGIELKLFVSNPSDCKKIINQIEALEQSLKNLDLWGGH